MGDIISIVLNREIILRKAKGIVNGKQITLILYYDRYMKVYPYIIKAQSDKELLIENFMFKFTAERYFKKLVKKYGLKEENG